MPWKASQRDRKTQHKLLHDGYISVLCISAALAAEQPVAMDRERVNDLGFKGCGPGFDDVHLGLPNQLDILHCVAAVGALAVVTEHSCRPTMA